jgi:hypothetical protein
MYVRPHLHQADETIDKTIRDQRLAEYCALQDDVMIVTGQLVDVACRMRTIEPLFRAEALYVVHEIG